MVARLLVMLIRLYQWTLSPLMGPVCRFEPSCSRYAIACLRGHGAAAGSWLALKRIARCHPFNQGGYDPPPAGPHDHSHEGSRQDPSAPAPPICTAHCHCRGEL